MDLDSSPREAKPSMIQGTTLSRNTYANAGGIKAHTKKPTPMLSLPIYQRTGPALQDHREGHDHPEGDPGDSKHDPDASETFCVLPTYFRLWFVTLLFVVHHCSPSLGIVMRCRASRSYFFAFAAFFHSHSAARRVSFLEASQE